jgi:hypothetical protein
LCLLHDLFREKILFKPRFHNGSYKGSFDRFLLPIYTDFQSQSSFSSVADLLEAWGLKNSDVTFVRREIRTLLFKYIHQGDAVVEYH